jgi:hypothetical protein
LDTQTLEIIINVANALCLIFCFTKMGIDAWAAIIPIYGAWCLYDRVWGSGWVCLLTLVPILGFFVDAATFYRMFKGFGKSTIFCLFGAIFQPIGIAICAFDGSTYCG